MKVGDLVWCVYHLYVLPRQGIIINIIKDMDIFYVVLIEDEKHTLTAEEVFVRKSQGLKYQVKLLKQNRATSKR